LSLLPSIFGTGASALSAARIGDIATPKTNASKASGCVWFLFTKYNKIVFVYR